MYAVTRSINKPIITLLETEHYTCQCTPLKYYFNQQTLKTLLHMFQLFVFVRKKNKRLTGINKKNMRQIWTLKKALFGVHGFQHLGPFAQTYTTNIIFIVFFFFDIRENTIFISPKWRGKSLTENKWIRGRMNFIINLSLDGNVCNLDKFFFSYLFALFCYFCIFSIDLLCVENLSIKWEYIWK